MPTGVPTLAFSATVLADELLSLKRTGLSLRLLISTVIVASLDPVPAVARMMSEWVACCSLSRTDPALIVMTPVVGWISNKLLESGDLKP